MTTTIQTTMHTYRFDTSKADGRAAWLALREMLTAQGLQCFNVHADAPANRPKGYVDTTAPALDGVAIDLETAHLFGNQWNTGPVDGISANGLRVFDWYEAIHTNRAIKCGHWLEQTDAMRAIRRDVAKCGYCGKQEPTDEYLFCPHCIDSAYLKQTDLHLTRMLPIAQDKQTRAPLTEKETALLLPRYVHAQTVGTTARGVARVAKMRADLTRERDKARADADTKCAGMLWLLDHVGASVVDNCIYYTHTGRFGFGWRTPVDAAVVSQLLDVISEFPFAYDIKCADGRTLSGN